ncbi:MAG: peptide ABC transporter substrate-binding protein [Dehalococcoidia bacterium]|nr:peptide ABC transporter substrate-binding protein [Dehalococcoidia bacterium]
MRRPLRSLLPARLLYLLALAGGLAVIAGWYAFGAPGGAHDRYVEGVIGAPSRINPLFARSNDVDADLAALIFSGLTRIDGDGAPRPDLAERWEVTPDGLTYTFRLRPGVLWHDGAALDAADVAFTIAQLQAAGFRGPPALAAQWTGVTVTVADPLTLVIELPAPSAGFLARTALGVLPRHLLTGLDPAQLAASPFNLAPVGSGPYRLAALDARHAGLERYAGHRGGAAALRAIELRFYADRAALEAALAGGDVNAALLAESPTVEGLAAVAARADLAATALVRSGYTMLYLNNQRAPLNDPSLRRAIAAAIDRRALLEGTGGYGAAGDGPIVPGSWAYAPGQWPAPFEADALFDAAAWPRGTDGVRARAGRALALELVTNADPAREALARAVAAQLGEHGARVTVVSVGAAELIARRLEPRDYQLALFGWDTEVDPDPYGAWHSSQIPAPGRNVAGYRDALADLLLEGARVTLDVDERRELYRRLSERFVEHAPSVVLLYPARVYVHPAALTGLTDGLLFAPADRFRGVEGWRLDGGG